MAQLMGGGFELGQTLSGSGAGKGRTRHGPSRTHDRSRRSRRVGAGYRKLRLVHARPSGSRNGAARKRPALPPEMGSSVSLTVPIRYSIN